MAGDAIQLKRNSAAEAAQKRLDAIAERLHQACVMLDAKLAPYKVELPSPQPKCTAQESIPKYFDGLRISMDSIESSIDILESTGRSVEL